MFINMTFTWQENVEVRGVSGSKKVAKTNTSSDCEGLYEQVYIIIIA